MREDTKSKTAYREELMKLKCERCGHTWYCRGDEPKRCPACSSYLWNKPPNDYKCLRCGHTWRRRKDVEPALCPHCKSVKWNIPPRAKSCIEPPPSGDAYEIVKMHDEGLSSVKICMAMKLSLGYVISVLKTYRPYDLSK